jgi:hypothetical protein
MTSSGRWSDELFRTTAVRPRPPRRAIQRGLLACAAGAALLCGAGAAYGGPCTAQIARLVRQIKHTPPGPQTGPTFPQTLGAQLHKQPTPRDVAHAEHAAKSDVEFAIDDAKKADAEGNADACNAALTRARQLYGID